MKSLMRIIMVVMTGNCVVAMPPPAEAVVAVAPPVVPPVVRVALPRPVPGSAAWMAWRMAYHFRGQFKG